MVMNVGRFYRMAVSMLVSMRMKFVSLMCMNMFTVILRMIMMMSM